MSRDQAGVFQRHGLEADLECGAAFAAFQALVVAALGPEPPSNYHLRCFGAARLSGLSPQPRNHGVGELTLCGTQRPFAAQVRTTAFPKGINDEDLHPSPAASGVSDGERR